MNFTVKKITACGVMTALLLVVQLVFSPLVGVEFVTVLLLCFAYTVGAGMGAITATAFSLLRCLLYPFSLPALLLYLVYFNAFAVLFGLLGRGKGLAWWVCPPLLALLAGACLYFAIVGLPVSVLIREKLTLFLWILFGVFCAILLVYGGLCLSKRGREGRELASLVAVAAFCTVCFTLLDDCITPLYYGYTPSATLAYFYASFSAMLPHVSCTVVTVGCLFYPLKKTFSVSLRWRSK